MDSQPMKLDPHVITDAFRFAITKIPSDNLQESIPQLIEFELFEQAATVKAELERRDREGGHFVYENGSDIEKRINLLGDIQTFFVEPT